TVPRSAFGQDLLYSFGAFMTVCQISRNDAEARVAAVLAGRPDPGVVGEGQTDDGTGGPIPDVAQAAHDQIVAHVRNRFTGHDMTRLIAAILEAEGFKVTVSPPGPDRGVDILAGRGPLGLDQPVLCVQVKATEEPTGVTVFRALQGTMSSFRATQGLLVSWSGFTTEALREARQHAFSISLWDQSDLVQAIYRTYERLSPEIQAELPLKQIWALVAEEQGG
ncbi:MAG: restriction endonuclease, partial [Candidatus Bipolaricaulia bacterium]